MPRGKKSIIDYDEEIEKVELKISVKRDELKRLGEQRSQLCEAKDVFELKQLQVLLETKGISTSQLMDIVSHQVL